MDTHRAFFTRRAGRTSDSSKFQTRLASLCVAVVALVSACASTASNQGALQGNTLAVPQSLDQTTVEPPQPPTSVDSEDPLLTTLVGPRWDLYERNGSTVSGPSDGTAASVQFYGDSTYVLIDGCNPHSGGYALSGSVVTFREQAVGGSACPSLDQSTQAIQDELLALQRNGLSVTRFSSDYLDVQAAAGGSVEFGFRAHRTDVTSPGSSG